MSQSNLWQLLIKGEITTDMYDMLCKQIAKKTLQSSNCPNYVDKPNTMPIPVR